MSEVLKQGKSGTSEVLSNEHRGESASLSSKASTSPTALSAEGSSLHRAASPRAHALGGSSGASSADEGEVSPGNFPPLTLYPAIDLLDGKVVRLRQGKRDEVSVYGDDVAAFAQQWLENGASWLHVVDLNAAFDGSSARQLKSISRIVEAAPGVPIQLGGGLRDLDDMAAALDAGVSRLFLGTVAVENPSLVFEALERFGSDSIAVAVDEKDGRVRTRGWVSDAGLDAAEFAKKLAEDGVRWILHSAIHRDGTLQGPDLDALEKVGEAVAPYGTSLICAGGVGSAEDLRRLRQRAIPAVEGAVAGRALYEDRLSVAEALDALGHSSPVRD